jgi:radical SAM protein with 4Fe4S-binding SPASM domain
MLKTIPKVTRLYVELTNNCNFGCDFCPSTISTRTSHNMEFHIFKKIIDEVAEEKITDKISLYLLGEPFLYPKIIDAVAYTKKKQLFVEITTNGALLNETLLKKLIAVDLDSLIISFITIDKEEHKYRNSKISYDDYYQKIIETIRMLKDSSKMTVLLRLMSTFTKKYFSVDKNIEIAVQKQKFRRNLSKFIVDVLDSVGEEQSKNKIEAIMKEVSLHQEQIIWLFDSVGVFVRPFVDWGNAFTSKKVYPCKIGYCGLAFTNMGILSDGDVVLCCGDFDGNTSLGNITESSLTAILNSRAAHEIQHGFNKCKVINSYCQKCLGATNPIISFVKGLITIYLFRIKSANKPKYLYLKSMGEEEKT